MAQRHKKSARPPSDVGGQLAGAILRRQISGFRYEDETCGGGMPIEARTLQHSGYRVAELGRCHYNVTSKVT